MQRIPQSAITAVAFLASANIASIAIAQPQPRMEPLALPPATAVHALTSTSSQKVGNMAQFYRFNADAKANCKIKTQGTQVIICTNARGALTFMVSYDSVRAILTVSEAILGVNGSKQDARFAEGDLVEMLQKQLSE